MKKYILMIISILALCFWMGWKAQAGEIQAIWEYPDPPPDLMGFEIYVDGDSVWKGVDPLQRTCQFICSLTGEPVDFTMTAYDASSESLPSEAYPLDPAPTHVTSFSCSELE